MAASSLPFSGHFRTGILIGLLMLGGLSSVLASTGQTIFASPDETATAVVARGLGMEFKAVEEEPLAMEVPWLHPRSWVSQGSTIVPIGFLGWPLLLSPFARLFGVWILPWLGVGFILSAIYPVFHLLRRRFSVPLTLMGTILLFTFPTVLLYTNRSLFANAPQLALLAWWAWLAKRIQGKELVADWALSLCGFVGMAAIFLRPSEGGWMIPWMYWWVRGQKYSRFEWSRIVLGCVVFLVPLLFVSARTYGAPWRIGYLLRDNIVASVVDVPSVPVHPSAFSLAASFKSLLPYGFHPSHIWWNIRSFFLEMLWPWVLGMGIVWIPSLRAQATLFRRASWRQRQQLLRSIVTSLPFWCTIWMSIWLLSFYGSGLYADHIRPGAVTIGNSFLRYLLPLVPLWMYLMVAGLSQWSLRAQRWLIPVLTLFFVIGGLFIAGVRDDEGLLATRTELVRYRSIRESAVQLFPPETIILSDRSDKIFFPVFPVVSPAPVGEVRGLLTRRKDVSLGLFARTLTQKERDGWRAAGVDPVPVASFDRERLYRLIPLH